MTHSVWSNERDIAKQLIVELVRRHYAQSIANVDVLRMDDAMDNVVRVQVIEGREQRGYECSTICTNVQVIVCQWQVRDAHVDGLVDRVVQLQSLVKYVESCAGDISSIIKVKFVLENS